jgi:hypothetical protein
MPTMPFYTLQIGQNFTPENVVPMRTGSLPREAERPIRSLDSLLSFDTTVLVFREQAGSEQDFF